MFTWRRFHGPLARGAAYPSSRGREPAPFRRPAAVPGAATPGVTVLKPLHGESPAWRSRGDVFAANYYGPVQMVVGIQDAGDPRCGAERLTRAPPGREVAVVVDSARTAPTARSRT